MTNVATAELAYSQGTITYDQMTAIYSQHKIVHYSGIDPDYDTTPIATYSPGRSLKIVVLDTTTEGDYKHEATLAMLGQYLVSYPPFGHLAVEAAENYESGKLANVRKAVILNLAQITGAATALWTARTPLATMGYQTSHPLARQKILKPQPKQWKGQKDKESHHKEIEERLNTEASKNTSLKLSLQVIKSRQSSDEKKHPHPRAASVTTPLKSLAEIPHQYKSHVMDSVGLALFCHDRINLLK